MGLKHPPEVRGFGERDGNAKASLNLERVAHGFCEKPERVDFEFPYFTSSFRAGYVFCRFPAKISTQSCKGMMIACLAASSADLNSSTLLYLHVVGSQSNI